MNTPGLNESKRLVLWRKFALSALGIICPEILLSMSASQWAGAQRCVKDFASLAKETGAVDNPGHQNSINTDDSTWEKCNEKEVIDMPKAFYIDMGGFRIKPKNTDSFPINGRDMYWLVKEGLVKQPLFRPSMIEDKNKVDPLLRTITVFQIFYFMVQVIGRWVQHLFVTTAELTTISFIICSILGSCFWWHKPCDVVASETIAIDITIEEIIARGAPPEYTWYLTPLDFAGREEWWWSKTWWNYLNILKHMGLSFGSEAPKGKPLDRISDSVLRSLPKKQQYLMFAVTLACLSIFFIAWRNAFPTRTELVMWRIVCIMEMAGVGTGLAISDFGHIYSVLKKPFATWLSNRSPSLPLAQRSGGPASSRSLLHGFPRLQLFVNRINVRLNSIRNNSPNHDPNLELPLKIILPLYVLGFIYFFCRFYILIEDAIGLRKQPASAYETVDWQKFWPHLG